MQPNDSNPGPSTNPENLLRPGEASLEQAVSETSEKPDGPSYCSHCGRAWVADQTFCPNCGYQAVQAAGIAPELDETTDVLGLDAGFTHEPDSSNSSGRVPRKMGGVTWGGGQIILAIIVVILTLFSAAMVASLLGSLYPEQEDAVATWISVHLMSLGIIATVWYFGLRHARYPLDVLRLSRVKRPRKWTVLMMLGVLATSLIATSIYAGIAGSLGWDILTPPDVESDIIFDGPAILLTFQALAFITPLSEEIFFRGFIFRGLLPKMGPRMAIVVSALVFSAFHLNFGVMIPIFITGSLLAWLYWRTGSLWASIGAHAGQNALAIGLQTLST